ncbi:hypothetical protein ACFWDI_40750 [Streptomyces sp. NPDC060064]|uniref:hypothetical protein n=1 Tax=Streptomyces sp. NPDC060064 TaxID=3347049 RepID=UPI0036C0D201
MTCTRTDALQAGQSYPPIELSVTVASSATGPFANVATVSGGGSTSHQDIDTVVLVPSLQVEKTHKGKFSRGGHGRYTISVANRGQAATRGQVTVTDTLPEGLTATRLEGDGWDCQTDTLTCTRTDTLPPGDDYPPITLKVSVSRNAPCTVTNTVTVTLTGGGSMQEHATDQTRLTPRRPDHGRKDPHQRTTESTTTPTACLSIPSKRGGLLYAARPSDASVTVLR